METAETKNMQSDIYQTSWKKKKENWQKMVML